MLSVTIWRPSPWRSLRRSAYVPVRSFALRCGLVDHPGPRKVHVKPIPLLGGIAIYLGFVLAILLTLHGAPQEQVVSIVAGATLVVMVGFLDDRGLLTIR